MPAKAPGIASSWAVQAVLHGEQGRLGPAGQAQFGEDIGHVRPGRSLGDPELVGDGAVREATGDPREDLAFA